MKEEKLRELLNSLTMTEKIGQLIQVPGNMLNAEGQELGVRDELGIGEELLKNVGSTLNVVGGSGSFLYSDAGISVNQLSGLS